MKIKINKLGVIGEGFATYFCIPNAIKDDNKVIETIKTDKDGNAKTKELNYGKYKVVEIKTNKYYNLNQKAMDVNVTEDKDYNYTVENSPIT